MRTLFPLLVLALSLVTSSAAMKLSSPDFKEGEKIPERFTCEGKDISPTLKIEAYRKERRVS